MKQRLLLICSLFLLITTHRAAAQGDYPEVIQVLTFADSTAIDVFTTERGYDNSTLENLMGSPLDYFNASSQKGAKVYFNEDKQLVYFYEEEGNDIVTVSVDGYDDFTLNLFVIEYPDNIEVAECVGDPQEVEWAIKEDWRSTESNVATYVSPVIGDLNGDGFSEIVVAKFDNAGSGGVRYFKNLYVYDGATRKNAGYKPIEITTVQGNYMPAGPIGLINIGIPLVVMVGASDGCLRAYNPYIQGDDKLVWKSEEPIMKGYTAASVNGSVAFADFNNDGTPEIYIANRIFNATNGNLLVEGPEGGTKGGTYVYSANQYMPAVADINGDGTLEYIAGTKIYTVDISAREMTEYFDITDFDNSLPKPDGITMLADFNKDGYLDVLLLSQLSPTQYAISIWDIKNKKVLGTKIVNTSGSFIGIPFIGDVDGNEDGYLEILVTSVNRVNGYRWNGTDIEDAYSLETTDSSGSTGITLFDFNQSGQAQLVYRDEKTLRILKAHKGELEDLYKEGDNYGVQDVLSGTFYESAVVADVDNDGQAEIITVGGSGSNNGGGVKGTLRIYKSGNSFAWAPARKVWNQYAYNVVNVNDDLTIPKYRINQARVFSYDKNGNPIQPYNNFLQQQTILDQKGKPFRPLPHAVWKYTPEYIREGSEITIKATIENIGDVDLDIPVAIVVYEDKIDASNIIGQKDYTGEGGITVLEPGKELKIEVSFSLPEEKSLSKIVITVNDNGKGETVQAQCSFVAQDIIYFVQAVDDHLIKEGVPVETTIPVFDNDFLGKDKEKDEKKTKFELVLPKEGDGTYVATKDWGTIDLGTGTYPQYGTIKFDDNYNVIYTPTDPETFPGRDEFTYKLIVEDKNSCLIDEATVVIEFIQAKDNSYALSDYGKATLLELVVDDDELLKDPENLGDVDTKRPVTIILPDEEENDLLIPQLGTLAFDPDDQTQVYYTPNGRDGLDVFEYQISYVDPYIYPEGEKEDDSESYVTSTAKVYLWVLNEDRITCNDTEAITLEVPDGAEFTWYDAETGGNKIEVKNNTLFISNLDDAGNVVTSKEVWIAMSFEPDGKPDIFEDKRIRVRVRFLPTHMYWNTKAEDNDWHNYANWTNEEGEPFNPALGFLPSECTIVHIPGDADLYPILDKANTNRTIGEDEDLIELGEPTCDQIIFHFGGEVARPDLLIYQKAFVHYNVGYYDKDWKLQNGDPLSSTPMERDRWYGLAVPLKKVATGDFSFGGWPNTWQMAFERTKAGEEWLGEFSKPFSSNSTELDNNYGYSYALWANGYSEDRGSSVQKGLNAVKGIIELPYFENKEVSDAHRIHSYNSSNKTSSFQYYYWQVDGLPLTPAGEKVFGTIKRESKNEAYRFIFDGSTRIIGGKTVFEVRIPEGRGKEVMIGNPMMSTLDFDEFYKANSTYIEDYYRLYDGKDSTFETYEYKVGNANIDQDIAPLQAFFISAKDKGSSTLMLTFPFEDVSVTRKKDERNALRSSAPTTGKKDVLYVVAQSGTKTSSATLALLEDGGKDVPALFYPGAPETPQLYLTGKTGMRNTVQYASYGQSQPFGFRMEKEAEVKLSFKNLENIYASSLILTDLLTGKEQDLLKNPVYTCRSGATALPNRFLLKVGIRTDNPTDINPIEQEDWYVNVYHTDGELSVQSDRTIESLKVYDLQGILRANVDHIGTGYYTCPFTGYGIYIVKVSTVDGRERVCKVSVSPK